MHDLENNDLVDEIENAKFEKEKIQQAIKILETKLNEYTEFEKTLEENEINLTDPDAKTVKFGAHQGTDVGYNIQAAVDSKNKLIAGFDVTNNSADQGELYNTAIISMEKLNVESIEILADKGYFEVADLKKCEENNITCYVSKPRYPNSTGDSIYFNDKFIYNLQDNTYMCPEGEILVCTTKKKGTKQRSYANHKACGNCTCKDKCTTAKAGRILTRKTDEDIVDIVNKRTKENKAKHSQMQAIIEHVFGTLKRGMNFDYLLLRGFKNAIGEVSIAFFSYNLKKSINILGVQNFLGYLVNPNIMKAA